ncbi:MAG: AAA family ATPase, partial [Burkholderiales bacterium]|nr:AAA family ATPase [Burkholderiales bacterium]
MGASVVATEAAACDQLHICLLGDLELRRGAAPLPLPPSRRTRALLGFLVASAGRQSRALLCDLLWDGSDDPRAALRWSLTKLRAVVDDASVRRLVADREHVGFSARTCRVDIERVRQLTAGDLAAAPLDALEAAAALLQREFLDGLELPDCYRFHHWCMAERERYGALRRSVLVVLIERLHREPERALAHGRAMVAADPLAEAPHATLVRLLAACGRYPEAERHYDWARALLQREVAIPRGGPLDEAIQRVRRERFAAGRTAVGASPAPPERARPVAEPASEAAPAALVGRARERAAIADVIAGRVRPRLLLFTGEPGIGKTRLLDHFTHGAQAAGRRVIRGRCFEAEAVRPYGLWLDALREAPIEGMAGETLERAAPLLRGQVGGGGSREQLFDAAVALIGGLAALQPLALVFDDLQWIDETSAALLHFLSRSVNTGAAVLLAGAARAGEVEDNRAAESLLQSLQREGGLQMLELGPLSEAEAHLLLDGAAPDPAEALRQSGGNPLYLIELARAARRGADGSGHSVEALIAQRLHALEPAYRELLTWAAAMGRELHVELLATIAGLPLPQVLTALERLERRGLIAPSGDGSQFDFAHDLVRQT